MIISAIIGFIIGFALGMLGVPQGIIRAVGFTIGFIIGLAISVVPLKMLLGKNFGEFRLVLLKDNDTNEPRPDQVLQPEAHI